MQINSMKMLRKCLCFILVLMSLTSMVSILPENHVHAASASDYISQSYASSLSVKTIKTVSLMSMPTTASGSAAKYTVPTDTVLTVKALHKNTDSKYFYEVTYYNLTLYVDATATTMLSHLTGDISVTGIFAPASLTYGSSFPIKGDIEATRNNIGKVTAAMYKGTDISITPALSASATVNGKSYSLAGSTIDSNMTFGSLAKGSYTYVVTAEAVSYYINDSGALTTSKTPVVLEKKVCAVTNGSSPNPVLHNGIDVSVWNGNIDWATVKSQIDFAIIRASWEETADTKFVTNANGCRDNGIPFGVYVYSYAESAAEAIGEAEYVLSLVDGYDMDLPIFFDFEDECQMSLSTSKQQEIVKAFCDTIYAGGRQPGLYTYTWLLRTAFTDSYYNTIPIWTAEINGASYTSYKGGLWMWQWSWVGQFNGMSGDVDCNKMYVDLPNQDKSDTSYLSKCTYYPSNLNGTISQQYNLRQYPSTDYSILSTLAAGTEVHVTGLYKNTYGNLWYQVEVNGVTGYLGAESVTIDEYLYDDIAIREPDMASNLAVGKGFYIKGKLSSVYNQLSTVNAKVYSGENTLDSPTIKSSYSTSKKDYNLYKSSVDYGLNFGLLSEGYYTYEVSVDAKNYYYNNGSLAYKTENVVVWKSPFTVGSTTITPPETNVCVHNIVTDEGKVPTCTEEGLTLGTRCTLCGEVISEQEVIPATGHSYDAKYVEATCLLSAHYLYTCTNCSSQYTEYLVQDWLETPPEGYDEDEIETKTQYRTSAYQEIKNYQENISNGTQIGKEWEDAGNTTITYAKSWPEGFDTSNSNYAKYNITPKTNSEETKIKYEVISTSSSPIGYLYYHWCRGGEVDEIYMNRTTSATKTDEFNTFHAYYDTKTPESLDDGRADDGSVPNQNRDVCKDTYWYYNVPIYSQTYKTYKALFTHATWTDWTDWSDVPAEASDTLRVETRQLYRVKDLGDHRFSRGRCLVCDYVCPHEWEEGKCNLCLMSCMHKWSDGECTICKQPCTHSWQNGVCTNCYTECEHEWCEGQCSFCGVGCAHIWDEGGCTECGHVCYPHVYVDGVCYICTMPCPGHEWVGGTCEICMLSCVHDWQDGSCLNCGRVCTHSWLNGICGICSAKCEHNWENSKCTLCNLVCKHSFTDGICTDCSLVCTHNWHNGLCTSCNMKCSHIWQDGLCTNCAMTCQHNWKNGVCTTCSEACTHTFTNGVCKNCNIVCTHKWEEGKCTICAKDCKHAWYDEECQICRIPCTHNWQSAACTLCLKECDHNWNLGTCTICTAKCEHSFINGYCTICLADCDHKWKDGICSECAHTCYPHYYTDSECTVCGVTEPDYYLFGYINGEDYGTGKDIDNIGTYKFENSKLVVKFTQDSFVGIKTGDNSKFYMTNGYLGDKVTLAFLYDETLLGDKADKLFVPKGREVTFTLAYNANDTLTLSYVAAPCEHAIHNANGYCSDCGFEVEHTFSQGECAVCAKPCSHIWKNVICTICAITCDHIWNGDTCVSCGIVCTHKWEDGICAYCQKECEHSFTDGGCVTCGFNCTHSFTNGKCDICAYICAHNFSQGSCTYCSKECDHIWADGVCRYCSLTCVHSWNEGVCMYCTVKCEHTYSKNSCSVCNIPKYYLVGYINKTTVGFNEDYENLGQYAFKGNVVTVNLKHDSYFFVKSSDNKDWYMATEEASGMFALLENTKTGEASEMLFIPGGVTVEFSVYSGKNDTLGLIYTIENCIHKLHSTDGYCLACEELVAHTYNGGVCTGCFAPKPEQDMYIFGIINGVDYGFNTDYANLGEFKFEDETITVAFSQDSYIGIKTKDNLDWYMTDGKLSDDTTTAVLSNTKTGINADLLFIPGGEEVIITIKNNGDDTFTLSYVSSKLPDCKVNTKYATLKTDGNFRYVVSFAVETNSEISFADMGLLVFEEYSEDGTINDADSVLSNAETNGDSFTVSTDSLSAYQLVDTVYMRVYVKLTDGTYIYGDIISYSGVRYANSILSGKYSTNADKARAVSLLNFIAASQKYNGYKTDTLANASLI